MKKLKIFLLGVAGTVLFNACRKLYTPPAIATQNVVNYLVVEGIINTQDSTIIRLSRTIALSSPASTKPELGANVTVISDGGSSYVLMETSGGYYSAPNLGLNPTGKYGLKIVTADGKAYQSDLVQARTSPPIDSVYYRIKNNGVQIYADTHDPTNTTRYYRWDFNDTYIYHSAFESFDYLSTNPADTVLDRPPGDFIYTCWRGDQNTSLLLNSSAKLTKDIITENPINFIPSNSEKIASRYSILVKQYALTVDAFNYYQQLQKNTEQLGTIFDPQPSELPGNIHCITTPAEPVIGYITAGSASQARIFIDNRNLPAWVSDNYYSTCRLDTALFARQVSPNLVVNEVAEYIYTGVYMPIYAIAPPGSTHILGYAASVPSCVDCTLRGTNVKPSFWTEQ
jgi:uncharacterized protein DUF4249